MKNKKVRPAVAERLMTMLGNNNATAVMAINISKEVASDKKNMNLNDVMSKTASASLLRRVLKYALKLNMTSTPMDTNKLLKNMVLPMALAKSKASHDIRVFIMANTAETNKSRPVPALANNKA